MAKVIDARRMGGDIIFLGKSVSLPYDSSPDDSGAAPIIGSLRYNPETDQIEAAMLVGDDYEWCEIGLNRGANAIAYTNGATFTGPLTMQGSQIAADRGIAAAPSISFAANLSSGFYLDSNAKLAAAASGQGVLTIENDGLHVIQTVFSGTLVAPGVSISNSAMTTAYTADAHYDVGTVLVLGGVAELTTTQTVADTRIGGVVTFSSNDLSNIVYLAESGRVQCLVRGPVSKGDLIVTSNTAGTAQAAGNTTVNPSSVIGRSLQNFLGTSTGLITIKV